MESRGLPARSPIARSPAAFARPARSAILVEAPSRRPRHDRCAATCSWTCSPTAPAPATRWRWCSMPKAWTTPRCRPSRAGRGCRRPPSCSRRPPPGASYGIRIFSPRREVPFAGHPSVGTAHAVLEAGLATPRDGLLVQDGIAGAAAVARGRRRAAPAPSPCARRVRGWWKSPTAAIRAWPPRCAACRWAPCRRR